MLKVAFFTTSLNSGGIENYLLRFLKFSEGEFIPLVICKGGEFGDLFERYKEISDIELIKLNPGYLNLLFIYKVYHILKKYNIDVVCDFTGNFAGLQLFIAKKLGITVRIAFYRGSVNHFKDDILRLSYDKFVKGLVSQYSTKILSNSFAALDYFHPERGQDDAKYEVIYNGIDSQTFCSDNSNLRSELSLPTTAFIVGHVGRYDISKNHKTIIQVAIKLCAENTDIYFVLCGKGVDEHLINEVKTAGLTEQIKLLGYRSDINRVLNTLNLFYFPSFTEGQPNALIEAMIVGLPFVASNIPPIKETVPDYLFGQLVAPDDVTGAMNKIMEVYDHDSQHLICKAWAEEHFSAHRNFSRFKEILLMK